MVDTRGCMKTRLFLSVLNVLILLNPNTNGFPVNLTFVKNAVARGAVCLDGSPSAYHFSPGFGSGVNNWLVHMEGGGWCRSPEECLSRIDSTRGSSKKMKQMSFSGILSNQKKYNPDFFNWNKVKVRYCDGSSFTGDVKSINPETNLHFRGATVWLAVIDDLLAKGMGNAENALLSGCSAGGLASILHCDRFGDLLPASATVKCLSDAGYFINVKDISGTEHIKAFFDEVVSTHGSVKNLPPSCTSRSTPKMCFFPQYVLKWMRTPVFILNAAYDSWQIKNILAPSSADVDGSWHDCKLDLATCSLNQLAILQGYRMEFLHALPRFSPAGMFINSCYAHCQSGTQATWLSSGSPMINGVTIAKAVGSWFYNRGAIQYIDHCPYPCKLSCLNGTNELEMTLEQGSNQSLKKLKPLFEY